MTTTDEVFFVRGLVSLTVTAEPLTALTEPLAAPNCPLPNRPAPRGRVPVPFVDEPPVGRLPPAGKRPPPKPPPPRLQLPDVGWVTETVVAVIGSPKAPVLEEEPDVGFPNAEMQLPTVTADAFEETICRKVVLGV